MAVYYVKYLRGMIGLGPHSVNEPGTAVHRVRNAAHQLFQTGWFAQIAIRAGLQTGRYRF